MEGESKDILIGRYFHSYEEGKVNYQGKIIGAVQDKYLVQLYEWLMGSPTVQKVVGLEDMSDWSIYDNADDMHEYYDNYLDRVKTT